MVLTSVFRYSAACILSLPNPIYWLWFNRAYSKVRAKPIVNYALKNTLDH